MTPQNEQNNKETYLDLKKRSKKLKKYLLLTLAAILLLVVIAVLVVSLLGKDAPQQPDIDLPLDRFYPTYEGDIQKNESYLRLNREISYCEDPDGYGLTQTVTEELFEELDPSAQFICTYFETVISGDEDAYNALFTKEYLAEEGAKAEFSPQMLHDMTFYFYSETAGAGNTKIYTYKLQYKIYRNDGSFRRDIIDGDMRPQFLVLTASPNGEILISDTVLYTVSGNVDLE